MQPEIENHVAATRRRRGLSAARLAAQAGVSRQTIYAIEAGTYTPNTAVALRLARILEARVEDLFGLSQQPPPVPRAERVTVLPGSGRPRAGQPVELCRVGRRMIASAPAAPGWSLPVADGVMADGSASRARLFREDQELGNRVLMAGCDPGVSVLARHVRRAGIELVVAHRNSSQALRLLKAGSIHIAGSHLRDEATGESNLPAVRRMFPGNRVAVISLAAWEEGLVVAHGNPKGIRGVGDLAREDVCMVNRETGAGSRMLLDGELRRIGLKGGAVRGYERTAQGHLAAAWQVAAGQADCCMATRAAARLFGLGFLPLVSERYDLVVRHGDLHLPAVEAVLEAVSRTAFRRELEGVGGYDTSLAGCRQL
jgi:molybdate-binding protein/DNA-binding XRE family transcriptional regulator